MDNPKLSKGQQEAFYQLKDIERYSNGLFEIKGEYIPFDFLDFQLVSISISISCKEFKKAPKGINFHVREPFTIMVPRNFPFEKPLVFIDHKRFKGRTHVQWDYLAYFLCLYQAEATEWNPSDGMFGFIDRLVDWLRDAALDKLDPLGAPLHPPVAYVGKDYWTVVIKPNTPKVDGIYWMGLAEITQLSEDVFEVIRWLEPDKQHQTGLSGAVYLLNSEFPFEYPKNAHQLLELLAVKGLTVENFICGLQLASLNSLKGSPLFYFCGDRTKRYSRGKENSTSLCLENRWVIKRGY